MEKINKFIPIVILIGVGVIIYLLIQNKKDTGSQSDLLLAMADKLNVNNQPPKKDEQPESSQTTSESNESATASEEEKAQIITIADKLCFNKELTADEKKFYDQFQTDIDKELEGSEKMRDSIVDKFMNGAKEKEFSEFEQEYYNVNQHDIDAIINYEKQLASIVLKITRGITDFSTEELQFQQNNAKEIEAALKDISELSENKKSDAAAKSSQDKSKKGANPPLAAGERLKLILGFFEDGIPKTVTQIAELYSKKTGTASSKGNISSIFGKLEGNQLLWQEIQHNSRWKIFYGLPEWFEGKKLKKEFKEKIA